MDSICYLYKGSARLLFIALLFSTFCACNIAESRDDCPPEKSLIYIRILDVLTKADITAETEDIENLTLYLFDRERKFIKSYDITPQEINRHIPIEVTDMDLEGYYATVWANLSELVAVSPVNPGDLLDDLNVSLIRNTDYNGFYLCPGDLFFGYTQLSFTDYHDTSIATVDVMRKNAQLYITVRGLENVQNPNDYYFSINTSGSGYDFAGIPISSLSRDIREAGILNARNDFVSPEPYFMIHSPLSAARSEDTNMSIHLFNTITNTEIISADKDIEGNSIRLESGKITNVLMEIMDSGDIQVQIVITDWDEIFQWSSWEII